MCRVYYHLQITAMYIISMGPNELLRLRGVRQNALGHTPVSGNARAGAQECCLLVLGSPHPLRVTGIIYIFFMQAILAYTVTHAAFLKVSIYPSTAFCPQTFPVVFRSWWMWLSF